MPLITLLSIENMRKEPSKFVLRYSGPLKQSRPGIKIPCAELKVFPPDRRISVFHVLEVCLQKTEAIRGNVNSLFISYIKPYKAVSSATIGRWIRSVMSCSGIDCEKYKLTVCVLRLLRKRSFVKYQFKIL